MHSKNMHYNSYLWTSRRTFRVLPEIGQTLRSTKRISDPIDVQNDTENSIYFLYTRVSLKSICQSFPCTMILCHYIQQISMCPFDSDGAVVAR